MKSIFALFVIVLSFVNIDMNGQTYTVYPIPQKTTLDGGVIELTQNVNIVKESGINSVIDERLQEVLTNAGIRFTVSNSLVDDRTNILVGINGSKEIADKYATDRSLPIGVFTAAANKFDPYLLQINSNHAKGDVLILGDHTGSAYYGMATLEQVLEQVSNRQISKVTFEDYAYTQYRGIVEGFYGHPYTVENRLSLMDYCKRYKMNMFVYGPKADPFHAGKWRDDYPTTLTEHERYMGLITQEDIRRIAAKAKACNVDFVWSIHPALEGGSINFNDLDPGVVDIMHKFNQLYQLGVRDFGVSVDDMNGHPSSQATLADKVQRKLYEKYNVNGASAEAKVGPLLFVPTQYALNYGTSALPAFKNIHKDVLVAFTGYDCFSNIRGSACDRMAELIGRNPIMWWNNPVNDDYDEFLYMHGLTARWTIEDRNPIPSLHGLILNPMNQGQASKIALFGAADYSWNPSKFVATTNWEASIASIVKEPNLIEALKTFINVLSAYTSHDTKTPEGESLAPLYTAFQSAYSKENVPSSTELIREMKKAKEACELLQTLKDSDNKDYNLFYEDIRCSLAKVQSMTDIVVKSLNLMTNKGNLSSWTDFADIQSQAQKIHTDSAFLLSVFEGKGTSTYETFKEIQPTPRYLDPFVDFLSKKIENHAPQLPERSRKVEVITNIKNLSGVTIKAMEISIKLSGLNGVTLKKDEYVGIYFNAIKEVTIAELSSSVTNDFAIEYSINGKEWTSFVPDGITKKEIAYLRIKNKNEVDKLIPINEVVMNVPSGEDSAPINLTTNMETYQTNVIGNVVDGNVRTFFWKKGSQQVGDYIMLDFGSSQSKYGITLQFNEGDFITGTALIQLSDNADTWETIATFTSKNLTSNKIYSCNAGGKSARYVRLYLQSVQGTSWLQLAEFKVVGARVIAAAEDDKGNPIALLDDRSLSVGFQTKEAGSIVYRFIENITINEIQIYHHSSFVTTAAKPTLLIFANGKWVDKGELDASRTLIDVRDLKNISQLKISWNKDNIPNLYEVLPIGDPYVEEAGTSNMLTEEIPSDITLFVNENKLCIRAQNLIQTVVVCNALGQTINEVSINDYIANIPLMRVREVLLINIYLEKGKVITRKIFQ
ncbi:MAG: beta-N-acetylglucosaminidase domain-containing protein [Bacteroides sp.]